MNIWRDGIMGVVTGDALGCPVQFEGRSEVARHPITGMRGYGTFDLPEGSWTDDSSLTLALLDSLTKKNAVNYKHIMDNFVDWLQNGEFTPYGYSYDIGRGTMESIFSYIKIPTDMHQGSALVNNNGNGSLMRIMPICLFAYTKGYDIDTAMEYVHNVSALTHAHPRAQVACGYYYCIVKAILDNRIKAKHLTLGECIQIGIDQGNRYYEDHPFHPETDHYHRLFFVDGFAYTPEAYIRSSGYVVDTLEASIWSLINTKSYKDALLKAVNLGMDTDTVGAVTGGLAGLYYGYESIPADWINALQKKDWLIEMCEKANQKIK